MTTLEQTEERYSAVVDYATIGLAGILFEQKTHAVATGRLGRATAYPDSFSNDTVRNGIARRSKVDYLPDGAVNASSTPPPSTVVPPAATRGTVDNVTAYLRLERQLAETFPSIADVGVGHRWSGKIAITRDDFPHIGRLSPRVAYAMGYGGRGVALANVLGKYLAQLVQGKTVDAGPMSANPFDPIPFHAFRVPGMQIVARWYQYLDAKAIREQERAA